MIAFQLNFLMMAYAQSTGGAPIEKIKAYIKSQEIPD